MKLILAIVRDDDGNKVMQTLNREGYSVTKMASTGGFLRAGNMTLLIGTEDDDIQSVINILKAKCEKRKQVVVPPSSASSMMDVYSNMSVEIDVGGATIFVLDVERFEKL